MMDEKKNHNLLKQGILMQEENGVLVIKTIDGQKKITKISPELKKMIFQCEQDMIDALGSQ